MSVSVTKPKASKRCPVCSGLFNSSVGNAKLKDGTICGRCARQVRVMYPAEYERLELKKDPLKKCTVAQIKEKMTEVVPYIEDLRAQYGYNAVLTVESVEIGKKKLFQEAKIYAHGPVKIGCFDQTDEVTIIHGSTETKATILEINQGRPYTEIGYFDWCYRADAGFPVSLIFQQKGLKIEPGDIIVKGKITG